MSNRSSTLGLVLLAVSLMVVNMDIPIVEAQPGVIRVPQDYSTIQAAVDAASPGGTILVDSGAYDESVLIQKPLSLLGVDRNTTIIQTPDFFATVNITSTANVIVANFSITIAATLRDAVFIQDSTNVTITECTITNSVYGVFIQGGNRTRVEKSLISSNEIGVGIWNSINATMTNNIITASRSLGVETSGGSGHTILDNEIVRNLAGVEISASSRNLLNDNIVTDGSDGIDIRANSNYNNITRNQVSRFTATAVTIQDSGSNQIIENLISDNHFRDNKTLGVKLQNAAGNIFLRNSLVRNDNHVFAICSTAAQGCPQSDISANTWDDGSRGNFWDNYIEAGGLDTNGDGIGDTLLPFPCPTGGLPCSTSGPAGVDNKPLMAPWQPPVLLALLHVSSKSGYAPLRIVFTGSASGGQKPYNFHWALGDGSLRQGQNVTHAYTSPGTFNITLTVTDAVGSLATANATVMVLPTPSPVPWLLYALIGGLVSAGIVAALYVWRRFWKKAATFASPSEKT